MTAMPEYVRPAVQAREFRDESGAVIRYGTRWMGSPPDDAYSRMSPNHNDNLTLGLRSVVGDGRPWPLPSIPSRSARSRARA
jgi:hypothetical protein